MHQLSISDVKMLLFTGKIGKKYKYGNFFCFTLSTKLPSVFSDFFFIYLLPHTYNIYNTLRTLITILKLLTLLTVLHLLTLHYNTCLMPKLGAWSGAKTRVRLLYFSSPNSRYCIFREFSDIPYPHASWPSEAPLSECSVLDLAPADRDKKHKTKIDESKFKVYSNYYFFNEKVCLLIIFLTGVRTPC